MMNGLRLERLWPAAVILSMAASNSAQAQPSSRTPLQLMPVQNWNTKHDAKGFQWDLNSSYGCINNGTNSCFSQALMLQINGSQFSASQQMMTTDGMEYVFTQSLSGVLVTRRVRFDLPTGTVRFLESFHNPGPKPVTLDVKLMTSMSSISQILTNSGKQLASTSSSAPARPFAARVASGLSSRMAAKAASGSRTNKDFGLLVLRSSTSRPAAMFYLCASRSKIKPTFRRDSSSRLSFSYAVTVPSKKTVSLLHGVAQRRFTGAPDAKTLAQEFKPFQHRNWTKDLPLDVRRTILNGGGASYGEDIPAGPLLQAAMELAEYWAVDRGSKAVLVQDENTLLAGALSGSELTVQTRFGETVVPLEDVAVLVGGAGIGRTMQVYLRNGEILVGSAESKPIALTVDAGLEIEVTPEQLNVLFTPAAVTDGKPSAETAVMLQTRQGDRLAVSAKSLTKLRAATAWGPLEIPMAEVRRLYCTRSPQPIHRLILKDRSRISVILSGDDLELETPRFGPVQVPPGEVTELSNVAAGEERTEGSLDDDELGVAHCTLLGENVLVGTLQAPKVSVVTAAGTTSVATGLLWRMERDESEEGAEPAFVFELVDESEMTGHFADPVLPIRAAGKLWQIPAHHVLSYYQPKPAPPDEEEPEPDEAEKTEPGKAEPAAVPGGPPPARPPSDDPFAPAPQPLPPPPDPGDPFG